MKHGYFTLAIAAFGLTACASSANLATDTTDTASADTAEVQRIAPGHGKTGFVEHYDTDGDGTVALAEFIAEREAGYKRRDFDGNGILHEEEYVGEYQARLEQQITQRRANQIKQAHVRFDVLDTDEDKTMTLEEFHASGKRMFSQLDSNHDGIVDATDTAKSY